MDANKVKEARKYRIYPNKAQQKQIIATINGCREMWNHLLSYVYQPIQELDEIQQYPDKQKSKALYSYLNGHLEISDYDKKDNWFWSFKDLAKELGVKEKDAKEAFDNKNVTLIQGYRIKKTGLLYEELAQLAKRLNKISTKEVKEEYSRLKHYDSDALENVRRQLKSAFDMHFKNPSKFGLPRFKSYRSTLYSGSFTTSGVKPSGKVGMCYINEAGKIKLGKMDKGNTWIKFINHYPVSDDARMYAVTFIRSSEDKYYATLHYEMNKHTRQYSKTSNKVGIDMNTVKHGLSTDSGKQFLPPDNTKLEKKLHREERKLAKRKENSKKRIIELQKEAETNPLVHVPTLQECSNYQKQRLVVAKLRTRITNRTEYWRKVTTSEIIKDNDIIAIEDLKTKKMTKKQKGRGSAQSRGLHKAMLDVGFYNLRAKLEYMAKWNDKEVIAVNPAHTSQTCHECGYVNTELQIENREWTCKQCGKHLIRDVNAAQNILSKALQ